MKERFVDLAASKMRCTAVFVGFPEGCEKGNCEGLIQSFAKSHLNLEGQDLEIERAHRSPGQASRRGAPRPIIVVFNRYTTRSAILANARRFLKDRPYNYEEKECRIFIDEILSKEIRNERKKKHETEAKGAAWKGLFQVPSEAVLPRQGDKEGSLKGTKTHISNYFYSKVLII